MGYQNEIEKDYSTASSALSLDRFYISATHRAPSLLGNNWRHTYDRSLSYVENPAHSLTTAVLNRPDSGRQYFTLVGDAWKPEAGFNERLEHNIGGGWVYTDNGDTKERYSEEGLLLSIENRDGQILTMQYSIGELSAVVDDKGRTLTFGYQYFANIPTGSNNADRKNRLTTVGLPDGQIISYQYDANGMLERAVYPDATPANAADNPYRRYEYGNGTNASIYQLTGLFDERGIQFLNWQHIPGGPAISSEHGPPGSGIDKVSLVLNADGNTAITNPYNQTRSYGFSVINGVKKITSMSAACPACGTNFAARTYDANGKTDIETDFAGSTTDTDYNLRGLLTQKIESANRAATKRTTQTDWHATFNVPLERRVLNASNLLEAKAKYSYNARGQAAAMCQIDPSNSTAMAYVCGSFADAPTGVRQSATAYCEQADVTSGTCPIIGLKKSVDGPRVDVSDITTYTYYQTDDATCASAPTTCPHRKGDMWKVANAAGHVTEYTRYDGAGRALQMKDANGVVTDMEYNARGWLTARKVRGLDDTGEFYDDAITRIEYDPAGQVTRVMQPDGYLLGDYIDFTYDAAHRLTGVRDALGNSVTYTLDNAGNRTVETTKDPNGVVMRSLSRVYDTLGRLQASRNAANEPTVAMTYDANDNLDITTDGLGRVTNQDVDPLNRLIKTIQDQGVGKINAVTQFEYDARDNLTKVIDPKNLNTSYAYNGLNDLIELSSPDTGIAAYTYDQAGNRKTQTDARGIVTTYTYDPLNRLTQVAYPTASLNSHFNYDTINAICTSAETFAKGRLTGFSDPSGSTQYCYDRFGNMTRKQTVNNGDTSVFQFAYTRAGRLSSITYPSSITSPIGMKVSYRRNEIGQVVEVVVRQGETAKIFANNITYYPFGPLSRIEFLPPGSPNSNPLAIGEEVTLAQSDATRAAAPGSGCTPRPGGGCNPVPATNPIVQTRAYDQDYAIQSVGGLNYQVDRLGNIESIIDSLGGNTFAYDHLDRLTNVRDSSTAADVFAFTYDATGNRLSKQAGAATPQTYAYPAASHRLDSVAGVARLLDANGNTLQVGTSQYFTYDQRNRMVDFRSSSTTIVRMYQYNAKGERVRKYKNAMTHASYLYDESGKLLSETKTTLTGNSTTQEIIWLDDMPIGLSQNGVLHGILTDHLNTPRQVFLSSTQALQWRWGMTDNAFGEKPAIATGVDLELRFPGQLYDAESGLHYNYFRDYESSTGRYLESDPIGLSGGNSTYAYVASNPFTNIDPLGLKMVCKRRSRITEEWVAGVGRRVPYSGIECLTIPDSDYNFDCTANCQRAFNFCEFSIEIFPIAVTFSATALSAGVGGLFGSSAGTGTGGSLAIAGHKVDQATGYKGCNNGLARCMSKCNVPCD